jgi:hypothetical protein
MNTREFEGMTDIYTRISNDALLLLNRKQDINPEIKRKAVVLLQSSAFRTRIKNGWDQDTLRGIVKNDPEQQEKLWAQGLAKRLEEEVIAEQQKNQGQSIASPDKKHRLSA